jgi:hypothetical protein
MSAWRAAAADLGLDVTAPFTVEDGSHSSAACIGWVTHFGSSRGTVAVGRHAANEDSRYDRGLFIETLNDWGWHGDPSAVPE